MKSSKANEIKLIFLLAITLVIFISLLTFDRSDIKFLTSNPNISKNNVVGFAGAYAAWIFLFLTGYGAYVIPLFIGLWAVMSFLGWQAKKFYLRIFGAIFCILAISSLFSIIGIEDAAYRFHRGGMTGLVFSDFLLKYLGTAGTFIVITVFFLLSLLVTTDFLIFPFVGWLFGLLKRLIKGMRPLLFNMKRAGKSKMETAMQKEKLRGIFDKKPSEQPKKEEAIREKIARMKGSHAAFVKGPAKEEIKSKTQEKPVVYKTPYELPTLDLLNFPSPAEGNEIKENQKENSRILEETLDDFGVEAKVVKVSPGPVITRYELKPARGVTINKITGLSDNIALAMKSVSIRIEAPIPGKGTVGVEVPNSKRELVYLRDVLESKEYKSSSSKLKLMLGKDISGVPLAADLDDMPHLLIAGATGSGKTVCINSIITTLLFNTSPDELRLLMIDPKKVELAVFSDLPHLLGPVVKDSKKAGHTLDWLINEMDRRFNMFSDIAVRDIKGYNEMAKRQNQLPLPYIVLIIDELHDLMMVARQEVENMITRVAQLSRAVGIHMIIATQRPSVDVITGVIKANLPARISFNVASMADSRTVIDTNGAEKLLGKGDMLFIEPRNPKPVRVQGCLVSDDEIKRVTTFIKGQRKPDFVEGILKIEEKSIIGRRFEKDEIYEEAVRLILQAKQASVSMLQRRLGVGYTKAARLIDMMEDEGIVGPYQGSKPREILIDASPADEKKQ